MRKFLIGLCAWELGALTVGRWPTVTTIVHQRRADPLMVMAVYAFTAWMTWHLLVEGR